jgi:addiction module HigA family antidote
MGHGTFQLLITIDQPPITLYVILMKRAITPGEILLEEYLKPMGISQNAMARAIGVAPRAINEIVLGKRAITPIMSIRFGAFFGQSEGFWHGLQVECEFRALSRARRHALTARITPAQKLIAA